MHILIKCASFTGEERREFSRTAHLGVCLIGPCEVLERVVALSGVQNAAESNHFLVGKAARRSLRAG